MASVELSGTVGAFASHWQLAGRPTRIIVDLDRIAANVRYFRRTVTPGTDVMAVVKADGYGHGAVMVAVAALEAGATQLAVATVDEGVALRRAAIAAPILVLGPIEPSELPAALANGLTLTIADHRFVDVVANSAREWSGGVPAQVHVKIDTGMRRFGAMPEEAATILEKVSTFPELRLVGTYSHLADADGASEDFSRQQASTFAAVLKHLRDKGYSTGIVHLSNSAAALRWRAFDHGMIRLGICLYGLSPSSEMTLPDEIMPALRLESRIARVTPLAPGDCVSYGCTYVSPGGEQVGLVPIGYADGYRRGLSDRGVMSVNGVQTVVRGRVCMDQTIVHLPAGANTRVGDVVDVISSDRRDAHSVAAIARQLGTIDYEVVTGLSRRIPRYYTKGQQVVAVQDLRTVSPLERAEL